MAGQVRHLKVKGGRFYARLAVPAAVQPILGKKELVVPLGADRREAMKQLPGAVASLQEQISRAERIQKGDAPRSTITTQDYGCAVWERYTAALEADEAEREHYPTPAQIENERDKLVQRLQAGEIATDDQLAGLDFRVASGTREFFHNSREAYLAELKRCLIDGETHLIEHEIDDYLNRHGLFADEGTAERSALAKRLIRTEIEAVKRGLERDEGDYTGQPKDPIVKQPVATSQAPEPVLIKKLFKDYIASRQLLGKHKDGARQWENAILDLVKFTGTSDAAKITKRNLLDWRDKLQAEGKAPKTIANVYLASVRAVFRWAFENDRLPTNEAATVRQELAKKVYTRERGYTTEEAVEVLRASLNYQPFQSSNPSNMESAHLTAAKRWLPVLCAFSGARIVEMAQLRKEDVREEKGRWVIRITPDAGSVKTGAFRDVPLHRQVVDLGFIAFVQSSKDGPLFHGAKTPSQYLSGARTTAGRLSKWLHDRDLVPEGVQPSHGWRHRFKTLGRELGLSDRIIDAIQGHAARTAADDYGDVSVTAKARIIDALPDYDLS